MSVGDFETAVQRLIGQVGHWEAGRWKTPVASGGASRGDVVFALVQRLADLGAEAERRRHRPVPRLPDTILPDQLRVMADDLIAAAPPEELVTLAAQDVAEVHRHL